MAHLKVRKLYERAGIAEMERASSSELELIGRLSDWANSHWGHMQPLPYPTWDAHEILDKAEAGDAFWCTFKAALFVQACNAAGLTARVLGINPEDSAAHTVTEVYNNEFRKWMLVDPWMNCRFERGGVPMSALELHDAAGAGDLSGITLVFGENGRGTEFWDKKTGRTDTIPHANARVPIEEDKDTGLAKFYYDIRIVMRNDHTVHPQSTENVYVDGFMVPYNARGGEWWGPQLKWADDATFPQITCPNTNVRDEFEWPLNEVAVDLRKTTVSGEPVVLEARFSTLTPSFSHYAVEVDGRPVDVDGDTYIWKLEEGENRLTVAAVNVTGRKGFPSEFALNYDPSLVDFSRRVEIGVPNPGFEQPDTGAGKGDTPSGWRTITSNALRYGSFTLDTREKHSGARALKASPAGDPETGVEYAFIVRSDNFEVNPATDVVYSIWLRAAEENTPVDIALLDSTYKGQGTYVERVSVGREWKRYSLPCRLHNEIFRAYVGFKVYTGTVWADDAEIIEAGRMGVSLDR